MRSSGCSVSTYRMKLEPMNPEPPVTSSRMSLGGGLDGPLRCLPQTRMAPAKPALETADQLVVLHMATDDRPHVTRRGPRRPPPMPPPDQDGAGHAGARNRRP